VIGADGLTANTEIVGTCDLCGSMAYEVRFPNTRDRLHNLPGRFSLIRCCDCTLVRLSPRPAAASLPRHYPADDYSAYKRAAGGYGLRERTLAGSREVVRAAVLSATHGYERTGLPVWTAMMPRHLPCWLVRRATYGMKGFPDYVPGGRALDVGCGTGVFLSCIRRHGWDVVGVDTSPAAAAAARDLFGITVHVGELENAPFDEQSFDFIHMSHVIEHVSQPVATLHRAAALLRPGGRLYIETPNIDGLASRLSGEYWLHLDSPRHLWLFSHTTLTRALNMCGFSVSGMKARPFSAFEWEATYRREEHEGHPCPRRPSIQWRERPRAVILAVVTRAAGQLSPRLGDILSCWAERAHT
jgi:SAM-dependent methyltransferase